jgi:enamine deaminase RidA (YjgF/YER057c/UK114 family)
VVEQLNSDLRTLLPNGWQRAKGFSYGVMGLDREPLLVAGQLAVTNGAASPDAGLSFSDQFCQCLRNVVTVVETAGGSATDVAALRVFVTDIQSFKRSQADIASCWKQVLGKHFPAMTLVEVSALFEEAALVEIEAVALLKKDKRNEI